jgi:hypothetical protein
MQPIPQSRPRLAVNRSFLGQLIDQLPAAVVVVNGPPFRGPLITCRHRLPISPPATSPTNSLSAVQCYGVRESTPRIDRQGRSGSTRVAPRISAHGDANGLSR